MWGQEPQLESVLERLKLLLSAHSNELETKSLHAKPGELLIKQAAPAECLLLLTQGKVAIQLQRKGQTARTLAVLEAEALLGEMGLFGNGIHSTDVRVVDGPAQLLAINGDDLLKAMIYDSDLIIELLALVSERIRSSNEVISLLLDGIAALHDKDEFLLEKV
ncbi:MAG: cyclic nucleotide-binding domain-containing protein, partial [Prochlorococcaceae cyanobacterium ETNP2_MAG_10]|nr:cyclic nucleotide-binding domain-containing protein [Prochlorococcaceae cyanobacterium ETNP2_MAG_10]